MQHLVCMYDIWVCCPTIFFRELHGFSGPYCILPFEVQLPPRPVLADRLNDQSFVTQKQSKRLLFALYIYNVNHKVPELCHLFDLKLYDQKNVEDLAARKTRFVCSAAGFHVLCTQKLNCDRFCYDIRKLYFFEYMSVIYFCFQYVCTMYVCLSYYVKRAWFLKFFG